MLLGCLFNTHFPCSCLSTQVFLPTFPTLPTFCSRIWLEDPDVLNPTRVPSIRSRDWLGQGGQLRLTWFKGTGARASGKKPPQSSDVRLQARSPLFLDGALKSTKFNTSSAIFATQSGSLRIKPAHRTAILMTRTDVYYEKGVNSRSTSGVFRK